MEAVNNESMKEMVFQMSKDKKLYIYRGIWIVICMAAVAVGGIYYFGILNAFVPNSEDLLSTQKWYLILEGNQSYSHQNILSDAAACLSVLIGGMSYFSRRLEFVLLYTIILGLSLWISVSNFEQRKRWSVLPLWAFFMIFVHTVQGGFGFGRVYEDTDLIYQLPYNYHTIPLIFSMICMMVLQCYLHADTGKKKTVIGCIGILIGIYAVRYTDLVYDIVFVVPFLIVLVIRGGYHHKTKKYILPFFTLCAGLLLLTRFMSGTFFERLWSTEAVANPYGKIYGETNWLYLDDILVQCVNYVKVVMKLFNVEVSNRPIISLHSVFFLVRIAFMLFGYAIVAKILRCSVRGKAEQNGYTMIDEILAWAFTILSCSFVFTRNGENEGAIRYYAALVPLLTMIVCRNIEKVKVFLPVLSTLKHKKLYFCAMVSVVCLCQAEPVWRYQTDDSYQEDCEAVIEYLRTWEAESYGYALAPFWLCGRLSAMTEGDILFFYDERQIRQIYGGDAVIKYAVVGWSEEILTWHYNIVDGFSNFDAWIEQYHVPLRRAVDLDYVLICEFAE